MKNRLRSIGIVLALVTVSACANVTDVTSPRPLVAEAASQKQSVMPEQVTTTKERTACEINVDLCFTKYANDHLLLQWNTAYDTCRLGGSCEGAWLMVKWNGMIPTGSGELWHYKIDYRGAICPIGVILPDGSSCYGNGFVILSSQGRIDGQHLVLAKAVSNGLGQ